MNIRPPTCKHDRRLFYIILCGELAIVAMLCATLLYYDALCATFGDAARLFYALPLARAMLEHTLATGILSLCAAFFFDMLTYTRDM